MNSGDDSDYRLRLAREARDAAQGAFDRRDFPVCVQQAQLAVENAAKAVLATQGPVPQTHEPADDLNDLLAAAQYLPDTVSNSVWDLMAACCALGSREHILASNGDESAQLTPRDLFDEPQARDALDRAGAATGKAAECVAFFTSADGGAGNEAEDPTQEQLGNSDD